MRPGALARAHVILLLAYLLLAVLLTWPTVTHPATHLPGDGGDDPAIAWNLWWVKHALLVERTNPLFTDFMFYPLGANLAFYTLTTLNALTALPLTLSLGVVLAGNLHLWFTMVAGAYGTFLLARWLLAGARERVSLPAAGLAGAFYALSAGQLFYVSLGQFNIASSHWVPFTVLFVLQAGRRPASLRPPALAALFLVMQAWAEMTYASFLLVFIGLYVAYRVLTALAARSRIAYCVLRTASQREASPWDASCLSAKPPHGTPHVSPITYHVPRNTQYAIRSLTLLALLFLLGISPLLAAMLPAMRAEGDFWVQGSGFAEAFSADLAGFLVPTVRHPLLGGLVARTGVGRFNPAAPAEQQIYKGQHIYLGVTLLLLAAVGLFGGRGRNDLTPQPPSLPGKGEPDSPLLSAQWPARAREGPGEGSSDPPLLSAQWPARAREGLGEGSSDPPLLSGEGLGEGFRSPPFWAISALFFAWLALGPSVHVNGTDTGLPGPFVVFQWLPFFKGNRYPSRYSVMLVLSLAVLAAFGAQVIGRRLARARGGAWLPAVCGLLLAAFLFEHLSVPLPQSDMRVPAGYELIAGGPESAALLDIPLAWRNGFRITGPHHAGFMFGQFYQTRHAQRLLGGNTSRNPEFLFQYFTAAPVVNSILALETGHALPPGRWEADRAVAGDVLRFFDVGYVVVRPGPGDDRGVTPEAALPYVEGVLPVERLYADAGLALYRVDLPPLPGRVEVSAAAPLARLYLAEGWGALPDRAADGAGRRLWAQRRQARLLVPLDGRAQAVGLRLFAPGPDQQLTLSLNGWRSEPLPLRPGWDEYRLALPEEAVAAGLNEIVLRFERLYPAAALPAAAGAPFRSLLVESAGEEVGDFGHVYLDGVDVSPGLRGYNVVAVSPAGEIRAAAFDTHFDPGASRALAGFLAAIPEGHLVAVVAADEASARLGEDAVAALRAVGAAGDLRGKFRWSHALVGRQGSPPGSALEALDGLRPVGVALGPPLREPAAAAAVEWIRFEAAE
jgi:hypothetical protein